MGRSSFQPSPALPSPATWSLNGVGDPQLWVKPHISSALLPPSLPTFLLRLLPPWPSCSLHPVKEKRPRGPSSRHTSSHPPLSRSCSTSPLTLSALFLCLHFSHYIQHSDPDFSLWHTSGRQVPREWGFFGFCCDVC